jgi:hypothetical protein
MPISAVLITNAIGAGEYHGIERRWNHRRKLHRGYPKYWVRGEAVTKRQYLKAAKSDKTLPRFRSRDNSPRRQFPPVVQKVLLRPTAAQLKRLNQ